MILKDQLYTIVRQTETENSTVFSVVLNPECFIYKAHFPGNPITPGVCIIQTACELLGELEGRKLEVTEVKNVKFLNILSPLSNKDVDFVFNSIEHAENYIKAKIDVKTGGELFTSISFVCE